MEIVVMIILMGDGAPGEPCSLAGDPPITVAPWAPVLLRMIEYYLYRIPSKQRNIICSDRSLYSDCVLLLVGF